MGHHDISGLDNVRAWLLAAVLLLVGAAAGRQLPALIQTVQTQLSAPEEEDTRISAERISGNGRAVSEAQGRAAQGNLEQSVGSLAQTVAAEAERIEQEERRRARAADWHLILVNKEHPIPDGYKVNVATTELGYQIDERCVDDLEQMLQDCRKAGNDPKICSAYRDVQYQKNLFNNSIWNYQARGLSYEEARKRTADEVAIPGTSEHELGLAVDLVSYANQRLNEDQENTGAQKWLMKNSWKYGWVLRYPTAKKSITGIIYEPWHYRYVGREYAREMYEQDLCLEEFLAQ